MPNYVIYINQTLKKRKLVIKKIHRLLIEFEKKMYLLIKKV